MADSKYQLMVKQSEVSRVLQLATIAYLNGRPPHARGYSNLLMAIPSAFKQWEKEYREYAKLFDDDKVFADVQMIKTELIIAFQFPLNFLD